MRDGPDAGAPAALEGAQRLGRLVHADVVLLHVLPPPIAPVVPGLPPILIGDVDKDAYRAARRELDHWWRAGPIAASLSRPGSSLARK